MPSPWYIAGVLTIGFAITFALRALPFVALKPLAESRFVQAMAKWLPVGILTVLAVATFQGSGPDAGRLAHALVATAVTVAVHLGCGRRTLLSVGAGTATFVMLVNVL
ncbi:MAG TPA: AzlD domain-containing protein [Arachnia sp.]|nr:AzlD domain-containing protein [Arachnia sp.]